MALSVGFGRITNDPEAPIRTRKALGRLATPGLLVTDKGLTIDTNGRMVLRLNDGLYEDSNGLSVKLAPDGGLTATEDGLALSDSGGSDTEFGDITVDSITVLGSATINVNANVAGNVNVDGIITGASANIVGNVNSVGVISTSVNTGTIICDTITSDTGTFDTLVVAVFNPDSLDVVGHATVGGDLTITGNVATAGNVFFNANATVAGTLTAGVFNPSSITTGAITCSTITGSGNTTVAGSVAIGTTTITAKLSSLATTEQLRLLYNTSNYCTFTVASNGGMTIQAVGTNSDITLVPSGTGRVHVTGSVTISNIATILGSVAVGGSLGVTGTLTAGTFSPSTLAVSGNATVGGTLAVTGSFGCGGLAVNNGTRVIRILSFYVSVFLGHGGGSPNVPDDLFFSLPGAVIGDACICSPLGIPGQNIAGWSAAVYANGSGLIRIAKSEFFGSTASMDFRITVIGFA